MTTRNVPKSEEMYNHLCSLIEQHVEDVTDKFIIIQLINSYAMLFHLERIEQELVDITYEQISKTTDVLKRKTKQVRDNSIDT